MPSGHPTALPPCVLHEDEHLLVVNKPAGWNTHAPSPYAGEGIYDWLRHRSPRWANLAIIHRLDKETSGVLVFSKSALANRELTRQFTARQVKKQYLLVADRPVPPAPLRFASHLVRDGDRYRSQSTGGSGTMAETVFQRAERMGDRTTVEAFPTTGRTHQIRVHAAAAGFPILGDPLYGGTPARRLHLHAASVTLRHPATKQVVVFRAPADWDREPAQALRGSFIDPKQTDAYRIIHGAADGWPGWYVDRLGRFLLSQGEGQLTGGQKAALERWMAGVSARGVYHKQRDRGVCSSAPEDVAPRRVFGEAAYGDVMVRENGLRYAVRFDQGYSIGLFLDQRDNRRRLLTGHIAGGLSAYPDGCKGIEVLNLFAYTCAFSVAAARAGARVTSVDLARKYLDWGRRHFEANQLEANAHDFLYGDAFDWLRLLAKLARRFNLVIVDPPTFSTSKTGGRFRAEADWPRLARAALAVLAPGGWLFASTNAARVEPGRFLDQLVAAAGEARRRVLDRHYAPQPPDFPICRAEPAHLKTVWLRIE